MIRIDIYIVSIVYTRVVGHLRHAKDNIDLKTSRTCSHPLTNSLTQPEPMPRNVRLMGGDRVGFRGWVSPSFGPGQHLQHAMT